MHEEFFFGGGGGGVGEESVQWSSSLTEGGGIWVARGYGIGTGGKCGGAG